MALQLSSQDTVLAQAVQVVSSSQTLTQVTITKCSAVNIDADAHSLTVYRVEPGNDPVADGTIMIKNLVLAANSAVVLPLAGQVLYQGQTLQASADANSVINFSISIATNV